MPDIVCYTDDPYFAKLMPRLFQEYELQVVPKNEIRSPVQRELVPSRYILGLPGLTEEDWELVHFFATSTSVPVYVMVQREITALEAERSRNLGLAGILLDPLVKLFGVKATDGRIMDALLYPKEKAPPDEASVLLGKDTYFHPNQHFILCSGVKTQLSHREAELLKLFLRYEGNIVTKETMANELWQGRVVSGGIPKLVVRLRRKLGDAGELIRGRKQGGYIYER